MLGTFINALLSADAHQVCGTSYCTISDDRMNRRNGCLHRDFDTRADTRPSVTTEAAEELKRLRRRTPNCVGRTTS